MGSNKYVNNQLVNWWWPTIRVTQSTITAGCTLAPPSDERTRKTSWWNDIDCVKFNGTWVFLLPQWQLLMNKWNRYTVRIGTHLYWIGCVCSKKKQITQRKKLESCNIMDWFSITPGCLNSESITWRGSRWLLTYSILNVASNDRNEKGEMQPSGIGKWQVNQVELIYMFGVINIHQRQVNYFVFFPISFVGKGNALRSGRHRLEDVGRNATLWRRPNTVDCW